MRMRNHQRRAGQSGFSMVEIIIVLVIILVLSAIAAPNLLRARDRANEAAAEVALRSIVFGQTMYHAQYQSYSPSLKALGPPAPGAMPSAHAADLIDEYLANGIRNGYRFRYTPLDVNGDGIVDSYLVNADPENNSAGASYSADPTAVVRANVGGASGHTRLPGSMGGEQ